MIEIEMVIILKKKYLNFTKIYFKNSIPLSIRLNFGYLIEATPVNPSMVLPMTYKLLKITLCSNVSVGQNLNSVYNE